MPVKKLLAKVLWLLIPDSWDSPVSSGELFLSACFSSFGVFVILDYTTMVVTLNLELCVPGQGYNSLAFNIW